MPHYTVTVRRYDDTDNAAVTVVTELHTDYRLEEDVPEWIKEEVDANAQTITIDAESELGIGG